MTSNRAELLTRLARDLRDSEGQDEAIETALLQLLEVLPEADRAGISLRRERESRPTTLATSDAIARAIIEAQYEFGEGPGLDATAEHDWRRSGDVARDHRWPTWGPVAARHGVGSVVAIPLMSRDRAIGAITIYSPQTSAFSDREVLDFASLFALHIAMEVESARHRSALTSALSSRHVIGIAQGILMTRYELDVPASFALLRRYSSITNVKLHEVAAEIVRTNALPDVPGQEDRIVAARDEASPARSSQSA